MSTATIDRTAEVLKEMLTENTGRHLLDSGDYYGRHWERNQLRSFDNEPEVVLEFDSCGMEATINVYHFLKRNLEFDEEWDNLFYRFVEEYNNEHAPWLQLMEEFPEWLKKTLGLKVGGVYGDGEPFTVNTYNHQSLLSQTLQYLYMSVEGEYNDDIYVNDTFILLQIHQGCDVRGGYTRPRVFREVEETGMLRDCDLYIQCDWKDTGQLALPNVGEKVTDHPHRWFTDDGYHFYYDEPTLERGPELQDYGIEEVESVVDRTFPSEVIYASDKKGHCPLCGAELFAWF